MQSLLKIICICVMATALLILSGCSERINNTIVCNWENCNCYAEVAAHVLPEHTLCHEHSDGIEWLKKGAAVLTYDILAIPALELGIASHWYPQYTATAVIAVDRNRTDASISGWHDLLVISESVGMSDSLCEARLLMAAMSYGLEGKDYTLAETTALLSSLYQQNRLNFNNFDAPVLICFDYQAISLSKEGREFTIIVPEEGTLTFEAGILSQTALTLSPGTETLLLSSGFRLPDGRTDTDLYPPDSQYRNAVPTPDYTHLVQTCEDVTYVLKRNVLDISSYLYSAVDGREQQLYALGFIILVILWTGYVMRRIMQKGVRRAITLIVILTISWVLLRMFKYQIPLGTLNQYCWYGYYLFRMALPLVGMWGSWMIDRLEDSTSPPRWWYICAFVNLVLFLLVFTNNLHYRAFIFDPTDPAYNVNFTYGPIYYLSTAATFIQILVMQCLFIYKSWKGPRRRGFIFPILFYALISAYCVGYILRVPIVWETDSTIVSGTFAIIFLEACIRSGLIPVNVKYKALFEHSPLKMKIVARGGNVALASQTTPAAKKYTIYPSVIDAREAQGDTLIYQSAVTGGTVIWQEDISSINRLYREINEANNKLEAINAMLIEEERINSRLAATEARTALFSELEAEIKKKTILLGEMIESLPHDESYQEQIAKVTLLLCYIKRRCILFFRERETEDIALDEIVVYLDELREFASYAGVHMHVSAIMCERLATRKGTLFYDFVYARLEWALDHGCGSILVHISNENDMLALKVMQPALIEDFAPEPALYNATQSAGGVFTIKDMEDATGIWLSFPLSQPIIEDTQETTEGGDA